MTTKILLTIATTIVTTSDQFPDGRRWGEAFVSTLRNGPPWPSLDAMTRRFAGS